MSTTPSTSTQILKSARRERGIVLASQLIKELAGHAAARIRNSQYPSQVTPKRRPTVDDKVIHQKLRAAQKEAKRYTGLLRARGWTIYSGTKKLAPLHQDVSVRKNAFERAKAARVQAILTRRTDVLILLIDADPIRAKRLCMEFQRFVEKA